MGPNSHHTFGFWIRPKREDETCIVTVNGPQYRVLSLKDWLGRVVDGRRVVPGPEPPAPPPED